MSTTTIVLSTALAGAIGGLWRRWSGQRNSLSDEEREFIFWNDRKYEMLRRGLIWAPIVAVLLVVGVTLAYAWLFPG